MVFKSGFKESLYGHMIDKTRLLSKRVYIAFIIEDLYCDLMVLGIILGSSVLDSTIFLNLEQTLVSTSFGSVKCMKGLVGKTPVVIIRRHQFDPERDYTPPHAINYRAMISAFHLEGCERIIALFLIIH